MICVETSCTQTAGGTGLILCLCGAVSAPLCRGDWPVISPSTRAEHLLIHRIQSHTNPKRRKGFLKQAGQKSVKEELPKHRKGPKRAVKCRLKVPTHIWEHDVGCSSHLTPTRKSRCGNPRRDFSMESCPCSQEEHSSSPGKSRPHLTYPSPETAVRTMRLVWSVL